MSDGSTAGEAEGDDDRTRAALERDAFGPETDAEASAAAVRELRRRDDAAEGLSAGVPEGVPAPQTGDGAQSGEGVQTRDGAQTSDAARPRRVARAAIAVGVVLVIGGVAGFGLARGREQAQLAVPAGATTAPIATLGGGGDEASDPAVAADSRRTILAAEILLRTPATKGDALPAAAGLSGFLRSSTRLVATATGDRRLWVARSDDAGGGYCLVAYDGVSAPDGSPGSTSCADVGAFVALGITLDESGFTASWRAGTVTATVTRS